MTTLWEVTLTTARDEGKPGTARPGVINMARSEHIDVFVTFSLGQINH